MDRWFEFGCVRGILGLLIGAIQLALATTVVFPTLQAGVQVATLGCEVCHHKTPLLLGNISPGNQSLILVAAIASAIIAIALNGFGYWLGAKLLEYSKFKVSGMWKAIAAGIIGSIVFGTLALMVILAVLPNIDKEIRAIISSIIIALPLYLIAEIGFAVLTWKVYDFLKIEKPT